MNWKNLQTNVMDAGLAVAGGAAGRVITRKVVPMIPFVKEHKRFHPVVTFLIGAAMMDKKELHYAGIGMAAVAGTDLAAEFVPMLQPDHETIKGIEEDMQAKMADELERRLNADVNSSQAALNADVNNPESAMNDLGGIEVSLDERLEGVEGIEDIDGIEDYNELEEDDLVLSPSQSAR